MKQNSKYIRLSYWIIASIALIIVLALLFISQPRQNNPLIHSLESRLADKAALLIEKNKTIKDQETKIRNAQTVIDSLSTTYAKLQLLSDSIKNVVDYYSQLIYQLENSLNDEPQIIDIDDDGQLKLFLDWTKP